MTINARRRPLHIPRVDCHISHPITMVLILSLLYKLARANVVHVGRAILRAHQKISIAVTDTEANLHVSILMVSSEFSDWIADAQVPQLESVVSTASKECIKCVVIAETTLIEFDGMRMSLVTIVHCPDRLVCISIVNYELFIGATNDADCRGDSRVMEGETGDMLGTWMRVSLEEFIETTLLQTLYIIFDLIIDRQFILVKEQLVSRSYGDYLIIIVELPLSNLLGKLRILCRGRRRCGTSLARRHI